MLGNDSYFTTLQFRFVFIWDALQRIRLDRVSGRRISDDDAVFNEDEEADSMDRQPEAIALDSEGRVTALTQFDQYVNRGKQLKHLSLYDYVACVKMVRVRKSQGKSIEVGFDEGGLAGSVEHRGRQSYKRNAFEQ